MQRNLDISVQDTNLVFTMSQAHANPTYKFWLICLIIPVILIAAYLVLKWYRQSPLTSVAAPAGPSPANPAPERERVLKLLDEGKITAQESADLLNALGHATPLRAVGSVPDAGRPRKLVIIGGALLLVGFFLPWFSIDLGAVLGERGQSFGMPLNFNLNTGTHNVAGGDLGHGLGWIVLLLGLAVAVLPYVAANLDPGVMWKVSLAGLGIGFLILLYLMNGLIRYVNIGIFVVLAGYAFELVGTLRQRPAMQR